MITEAMSDDLDAYFEALSLKVKADEELEKAKIKADQADKAFSSIIATILERYGPKDGNNKGGYRHLYYAGYYLKLSYRGYIEAIQLERKQQL